MHRWVIVVGVTVLMGETVVTVRPLLWVEPL